MNRRTITTGLAAWTVVASLAATSPPSTPRTLDRAQKNVVKIHGAGGFHGLEAYQSGLLISVEGHILTVFSYVLDTDAIGVTLDDGRKFDARLVGAHPRLELAVLKIDAHDLPHFDLNQAVDLEPADRVFALSNLFGVATGDEPVSIQHGVVSVVTSLAARRGVFETPYHGPVYVLDVRTNNPGAAGGALVTPQGRLAGMLGKELQSAADGTWLNHAIPIRELRGPVEEILAGRFVAESSETRKKPAQSITLADLGLTLVPEVLPRTPPYVDAVRPDSPAARAGLLPDDLVVLIDDRLIQTCKTLREELEHRRPEDTLRLSVLRGQDLHELTVGWAPPTDRHPEP